MNILAAILLCCVTLFGWLLQLLGVPGTWLIVAAAALYAWVVPEDSVVALGWWTVGGLLLLAMLAELLEFIASAMGVKKAGGSRRGALLAIVGSIVGGIFGMGVGIPIPVIGSLVAAVFFGAAGALVGAFLGESWKGRDFDTSVQIGKAAFVGRLLGTLAKVLVATIMVVITLGALVL